DARPAVVFDPALPAGTYHLVVDGYAGESGPFDLFVTAGEPLAVPENDQCSDALLLDASAGEVTAEECTWLASNDLEPGSDCTGSPTAGPDVAYAVDLTAGDLLTVTLDPEEGFDAAVYLLESCDAAQCLTGADESFVSEPESISHVAASDGRYFVIVDSWNASEAGCFDLTITVE
ncbi:MAG: hypothetical protein ACOCVR_00535, partial [Myxococcota bacterium]